jgi:2-oxoglutarate dehydrogenase complex dehydrogenase (E1) component-like enzyme
MPELIHNKDIEKLKQFKKDFDWFQNNYSDLKKNHIREYVAILNETLIDNDKSLNKLMSRLKKKYKDTNSIVVEYINEKKEIYIL